MPSVRIYTRLSHDPDGNQTATQRQEQDARSLCTRQGWGVAEIYEDAGISAYQRRRRPAFERLIEDTRPGDVIVCWRVDRIARASRDWSRLMILVDDSDVRIIGVADGVDTETTGGRLTLGILAEIARNESATLAVRIRRKHLELAAKGRPSGGGYRPFGFSDWSTLDEYEAALVREAVRRVLAGESIRSILIDWNTRGIKTPTGGRWQPTPLRRMLRSARIAGAREHAGELVATGAFPAIISVDTLRRVRAVLDDPARRTTLDVRVRVNLLPGLVVCGRCDGLLVGRPRGDGVRRYLCPSDTGRGGCNGCAILADPVEELVRDAVLAVLDTPRLFELLRDAEDDAATRETTRLLAEAEAGLAQASRDYYVDRVIGREEFFAARDVLQVSIATAREQLARTARRGVLANLSDVEAARRAWDERGLEWRRSLVSALVARITIMPAVRGRNVFDPSRVVIEWRA